MGVFVLCGMLDLDRVRRVKPRDRAAIRSHIDWFNEHLPAPPEEVYRNRNGERPFTWFKSEAPEMFQRAYEMARLAREYGHLTRVIKTRNPGEIVYEDDWQVVSHATRATGMIMPVERPPRVCREVIRRARAARL